MDNQCHICNKEKATKRGLEAHLWRKHDVNTDDKFKVYSCPQDGTTFKTKIDLNRHMWAIHDVSADGRFENERTQECPMCTAVFQSGK